MTPAGTFVVGVTGGMGSGKSLVCRVCALRGIPVYDCDSRAKALMVADRHLADFLCEEVGEEVFCPDGSLNRPLLSLHIFTSSEARRRVEARVHAAVRADMARFISQTHAPAVLVESAILHTSCLDELVDEVWLVEAPVSLRERRVAERSSMSVAEIRRRMAAQQHEFDSLPADKLRRITNDGVTPLLPCIDNLLLANSN